MDAECSWQYTPALVKQEPLSGDKTDSGINSGSDFHSSSPGSDTSQDFNIPFPAFNVGPTPQSAVYSTPLASTPIYAAIPTVYSHNLLTPPSSVESVISPKSENGYHHITSTTAAAAATAIKSETGPETEDAAGAPRKPDAADPLRCLQLSVEKNCQTANTTISSKSSEHSMDEDNKSDNDTDDYDEPGLKVPKVDANGKLKTFKCKQCGFVSYTKYDFWSHGKTHIKKDKLIECPKCPFGTDLKHHLEYHLRNHTGSKPFKCNKCSYSCVNKSMLNSHMKSHSNIYQYRCADCNYATKYCHSLKLHLRKYSHKPDMVLNPDGTPNPLPIIDVYGTRRGPKLKTQQTYPPAAAAADIPKEAAAAAAALPFHLKQLMMPPQQLQLPFMPQLLGGLTTQLFNPQLIENFRQLIINKQLESGAGAEEMMHADGDEEEEEQSPAVLDLSKTSSTGTEGQVVVMMERSRRKGRAFKVDIDARSVEEEDDDEEFEETDMTTMFSNVEVVQNKDDPSDGECDKDKAIANRNKIANNNNDSECTNCQYCNIMFGDPVLFTLHMGYHGYNNPFTCNRCGTECNDKTSFFLHIARMPHP